MKKTAQCAARLTQVMALAVLCLLFALLETLVSAPSAQAEELECSDISFAYDDDGVRCEPSTAWNIVLGFSTNVAVAQGDDDSFIQRNLSRVHLFKADGSEAPNWHASVQGGGRRAIYIELEDWLEPLTEYKIVVDAGLESADGTAVMPTTYTQAFKTSSQTKNGFTVYQNLSFVLVPLLLVAGIAVQVVRTRRQRP